MYVVIISSIGCSYLDSACSAWIIMHNFNQYVANMFFLSQKVLLLFVILIGINVGIILMSDKK